MEVERTFDLLDRYSRLYTGKDDALCCKIGGNWVKFSTKEYIDNSYNFSFGLLEKGLKKGDRIITITNNRPERNFADRKSVV